MLPTYQYIKPIHDNAFSVTVFICDKAGCCTRMDEHGLNEKWNRRGK